MEIGDDLASACSVLWNIDINKRGLREIKQSTEFVACALNASCDSHPMALPGGYPNMLGPDDSEQIPFAYGSNAERLIAAKKRFDPDDVFSSATPLRVR